MFLEVSGIFASYWVHIFGGKKKGWHKSLSKILYLKNIFVRGSSVVSESFGY